MGRPKTGDRAARAAASAQVSRRTLLYAKKASRSPFLRLAVDAGKIAVRHAAYLADYDDETQKWALEPAARKDVLERVKLLRMAEAKEAGLPSLGLDRLQKAWGKANDEERQAFLIWIAETTPSGPSATPRRRRADGDADHFATRLASCANWG